MFSEIPAVFRPVFRILDSPSLTCRECCLPSPSMPAKACWGKYQTTACDKARVPKSILQVYIPSDRSGQHCSHLFLLLIPLESASLLLVPPIGLPTHKVCQPAKSNSFSLLSPSLNSATTNPPPCLLRRACSVRRY